MAADFTMAQPGGAGSGALNTELLQVRSGVAVSLTSATYASYAWAIVQGPTGGNTTVGTNTSQVASFTPAPGIAGRYQVQLAEPGGSRILILEVDRDDAGALIKWGLNTPSHLETLMMGVAVGAFRVLEAFRDKVSALVTGLDARVAILESAPGGGGSGTVTNVVSTSGEVAVTNGTTIPDLALVNNTIALARIVNLAAARVIGSIAGGAPAELTPTQVTATMVEDATTSLPGRLSAAFWNLLTGATSAATASTLAVRDASADLAVRRLTVTDQINATGALTVSAPTKLQLDATGGSGEVEQNGATLDQNFTGNHDLDCFSHTVNASSQVSITAQGGAQFNGIAGASIYGSGGVILGSFVSGIDARPGNGKFAVMGYLDGLDHWTFRFTTADAQTANATTATAGTFVPSARGGKVKRVVRARQGDNRASWTFYYDASQISGAAAWTGGDPPVAVDFAADAALIACQCELDLSGTGVRSRVTGIAATTIDWSDALEILS